MQDFQAFSDAAAAFPIQHPSQLFLSSSDANVTRGVFHTCFKSAVRTLLPIVQDRQSIVFVVSDNTVESVVAMFALNYCAQVVVPVYAGYTPSEMLSLWDVFRPSLVLYDEPHRALFACLSCRVMLLDDLLRSDSEEDIPPGKP